MNFTILPMMTEDDIRGKAYVHWKSWQETYPGLMPQRVLDHMTLEKCEAIAFKWPEGLLVAKVEGRVIGFAGYGAYRDDSLPGTGEVYALYVLREFHDLGIGRALMDAAVTRLAEYPRVALWVLQGNARAIRFYEKYGFRFDGTTVTNSVGTEARMILQRNGGANGEAEENAGRYTLGGVH